jgi:hypothetical protein
MTPSQEAYAKFIKSVCEAYDCPDAIQPLTEGFDALCEAKGWWKPLAVAGGIAALGAGANAAHNYDQETRTNMLNAHWNNCGFSQSETTPQYMPSNNSEEAIETAYKLSDELYKASIGSYVGKSLSSTKIQNQLSKDTHAVENAKTQEAKKAATQKLNADIRQGNRLLSTINHGGMCPDGKTVFATPKSTILKTWDDEAANQP